VRRLQAAREQAAYDALPLLGREAYMLPLRPLKLVIMSATLRIEDFLNERLFPPPTRFPPVIKVCYAVMCYAIL
jgi:ATP-dependent RNA helicase DHX37/DHR1